MTGPASLIRSRNQTSLIIAWLLVAMLIAWANTPLLAQQTQETPEDLTDLTLDELMELDVLYVNVLGTHTHLAGEIDDPSHLSEALHFANCQNIRTLEGFQGFLLLVLHR